jgi:hypothetical protein
MFKTIGYVFLVLLIGTFAIAWSHKGSQKTATLATTTLAPDTYHLNAKSLPLQEANDMSFIYTNEK